MEPPYVRRAVSLSKKALLEGTLSTQKLSDCLEVVVYERKGSDLCAAFITNNHTEDAATVNFRGQENYLPSRSVSIPPDCKTVAYNTQTIVSQHNSRNFKRSEAANKLEWEISSEIIPTPKELPVNTKSPKELYTLLRPCLVHRRNRAGS